MPAPDAPGQAKRVREPSLADAIIPLVTLAVLIAGSLLLFGLAGLDGPIQVALMLSAPTAALIVLKKATAGRKSSTRRRARWRRSAPLSSSCWQSAR